MEAIPGRHTKKQKEMARKRTDSGQRKAQETGVLCNIFVAYVFWNPTYRRLEGVMHCPKGMEIPDINGYVRIIALRLGWALPIVAKLQGRTTNSRYATRQRRRKALGRRRISKVPKSLILDEITVEADDSPEIASVRETADDSPASRVATPEEEPVERISKAISKNDVMEASMIQEVDNDVGANEDSEVIAVSAAIGKDIDRELPSEMHDDAPTDGNEKADVDMLGHNDAPFGGSEEVDGGLSFGDVLQDPVFDLESYGNFMMMDAEHRVQEKARDHARRVALLLLDFNRALRA